MSQARKYLLATLSGAVGGIAIHLTATALWESSVFSGWRTNNPITSIVNWLSGQMQVNRLSVSVLLLWSLSASVYIASQIRRVVIYTAFYGTDKTKKDVSELIREKVGKGIRRIPVSNDVFGGDPDYGTEKSLTIDYSVWNRRRKKTAKEKECLELD